MSEQTSTDTERVCWFCDSEEERKIPSSERGLMTVLMFVAVMSHEKMMEALCDRHRAAMTMLMERGRAAKR